MHRIKYLISIIILLCLPIIAQLNRLTGNAGMDSVHSNEPMNFIVPGFHADSTGEKNETVPENHQLADSIRSNFNYYKDGWYWFIGINIYPNELKNN